MKKHHLQAILCLLLFPVISATYCEETYLESEIDCLLTEVKVNHKDNSGQYPEIPGGTSIKKEAYLLEIYFQTEESEESNEQEPSYITYQPVYKLNDGIAKIDIFSEETFNKDYPKGADITSCFKNYPFNILPEISSRQLLRDITIEGEAILFVSKTNLIWKSLMTTPDPGLHQFRVVLTMASGTTIEQISSPIHLY